MKLCDPVTAERTCYRFASILGVQKRPRMPQEESKILSSRDILSRLCGLPFHVQKVAPQLQVSETGGTTPLITEAKGPEGKDFDI